MVNRAALVIRYKQPFIDWINSTAIDGDRLVCAADLQQDSSVYLLEESDSDDLQSWLEVHATSLFEQELEAWYLDTEVWPQDRSAEQFAQWCHCDLHSIVIDMGRTTLREEGTEGDAEPYEGLP